MWGPAYAEDTQVLRTTIARLRGKIEREAAKPRYIHTDPGIGYRLAALTLSQHCDGGRLNCDAAVTDPGTTP